MIEQKEQLYICSGHNDERCGGNRCIHSIPHEKLISVNNIHCSEWGVCVYGHDYDGNELTMKVRCLKVKTNENI